jgi:predicted XRE-type DNA-binding protein
MIEPSTVDIKKRLAAEIVAVANETNFFVAARALELDPARLSDLRKGRVERFTIDRLIRVLAIANRRVDISIEVVHSKFAWSTEKARHDRERRARRAAAAGGLDGSARPIAKFGNPSESPSPQGIDNPG